MVENADIKSEGLEGDPQIGNHLSNSNCNAEVKELTPTGVRAEVKPNGRDCTPCVLSKFCSKSMEGYL